MYSKLIIEIQLFRNGKNGTYCNTIDKLLGVKIQIFRYEKNYTSKQLKLQYNYSN